MELKGRNRGVYTPRSPDLIFPHTPLTNPSPGLSAGMSDDKVEPGKRRQRMFNFAISSADR